MSADGSGDRAPVSVRLRAATERDVPAIAVFQTECWREAYRGLVPDEYLARVTAADREPRWRQRLVSGARRIVLAESGAALVGVVSWGMSPGLEGVPPLELMSLYVAASHRGRRVADALVEASIGDAPAHLWVFGDNRRAISFYARHGFRPAGHERADPDTGLTVIRLDRALALRP